MVAIEWVRAFLNGVQGNMLTRILELGRSHEWSSTPVLGAGSFLVVDRKLVSWFATKFDDVDEKVIGIQFGKSDSQQVAEALAVLVGVRAWLSIWLKGLPILEVKSGSVAALTLWRACTHGVRKSLWLPGSLR